MKNKNEKEKLDRVTYKSRNTMTKEDNMRVQFLLLICNVFFQVSTSILSPPMIPIQAENKGLLEKKRKA